MTTAPPPFDPELAAALVELGDLAPTTATPDDIPAARERLNGDVPLLTIDELSCGGLFDVEERTVPGPPGAPDVSLLICRPTSVPGPRPVVYFTHPGGMIVGHNRLGLPLDWAEELGLVVVSVEYRLAPEHPHPAPIEDCYAGLLWTVAHAEEIGGDPDRVILAGGSAGGGLAAALALLARDRRGPRLLGQLLMCPMLDDRNDTVSAHQMAGLGVWDRTANETGWSALLGERRGTDDVEPYAAPARAADLSGLPPAFIDVGSAETFRDEDVTYASRIWQAGGSAELHVWPGGFHGFDGLVPQASLSADAREARLRWLRRLLGE
ncbi:alpha/beta hydrolase [Streptomyces stelliscabiei]|uniref:Acetyl esterase/lipase n=1 Tax=Streptomyces stelliscabiei TaxID=146820 RepID=A0A8I0NZK3_9ACTN|nr:alpha/beta hydrolase [Streptomyces stelliscabiei]KND43141.1 esterase [Streptomyces stelliscabiei]MBE1594699.1 acetyl esterase/lipase [Streptomyces stelliscabiei]MDX2518980.1 alpha/beta hydrolase [Streptomyces stelliscabiei]MDX2550837.1 alpha/beta hydrolase [Streptomyces stelliscabiei]MDX2616681.1 alpha/beta hydrolase [Streptomyces stelliscabiei]